MSITVTCGGCNTSYKVDESKGGKKLRCKTCAGVIEVPMGISLAGGGAKPVTKPVVKAVVPQGGAAGVAGKKMPPPPPPPSKGIVEDPLSALQAAAHSESQAEAGEYRTIDLEARAKPAAAVPRSAPGMRAQPTVNYQSLERGSFTTPARQTSFRILLVLSILMYLGGACIGVGSVIMFVGGAAMASAASGGGGGSGGSAAAVTGMVGVLGAVIAVLALVVIAWATAYLICGLKIRKGGRASAIVALVLAGIHGLLTLVNFGLGLLGLLAMATRGGSGGMGQSVFNVAITGLLLAGLVQLIINLVRVIGEPRMQ